VARHCLRQSTRGCPYVGAIEGVWLVFVHQAPGVSAGAVRRGAVRNRRAAGFVALTVMMGNQMRDDFVSVSRRCNWVAKLESVFCGSGLVFFE